MAEEESDPDDAPPSDEEDEPSELEVDALSLLPDESLVEDSLEELAAGLDDFDP